MHIAYYGNIGNRRLQRCDASNEHMQVLEIEKPNGLIETKKSGCKTWLIIIKIAYI